MLHFRKHRKSYVRLRKADEQKGDCPFCRDIEMHERVVKTTATMFVIPNRTQYDMFEGMRVQDHLMVIPKRHVDAVDQFTNDEKIDMMDVIAEYERKGYNVYARGLGSSKRSVQHQHTHLIKLHSGSRPKFIFYNAWPYLLISR